MEEKPNDIKVDLDDKIDLGVIAKFLQSVHPKYSMHELVAMLAELAPIPDCTCTRCSPTKFPACLQKAEKDCTKD